MGVTVAHNSFVWQTHAGVRYFQKRKGIPEWSDRVPVGVPGHVYEYQPPMLQIENSEKCFFGNNFGLKNYLFFDKIFTLCVFWYHKKVGLEKIS